MSIESLIQTATPCLPVNWPLLTAKVVQFVKQNWLYFIAWLIIGTGVGYVLYKCIHKKPSPQTSTNPLFGVKNTAAIERATSFLKGTKSASSHQRLGIYAEDGFGKGTVARLIATQAGAKLIEIDAASRADINQIFTEAKAAQPTVLVIKNFKHNASAIEQQVDALKDTDRIVVIFVASDATDPSSNMIDHAITISELTCDERLLFLLRQKEAFEVGFDFTDWAARLHICKSCGELNDVIESAKKKANGRKITDHHLGIVCKERGHKPDQLKPKTGLASLFAEALGATHNKDNVYEFIRDVDTRFADVGGNKKAKEALKRNLHLMAEDHQERAEKLGLKPSHIIMHGKPGIGKTLLARALAGECDCAFISTTASQFVTKWQGSGAENIKALFCKARSAGKRCIIFIDEIDSLGSRKELTGMQATQVSAINELLAQIDGLEKHNITVIGATNNLQSVDEALLRDGRMKPIEVKVPSKMARMQILEIHAKNRAFEGGINWESIANKTKDWTGAELEGLINDAAVLAFDAEVDTISQADLDVAYEKRKEKCQSVRLSYVT